MTLENLISELLLRHNCVVIPSFGGFVAGQIPSHFDSEKGVILPPRKSLLFNKQLISNDGLLIATYAKHNHLNYDVAEFFIRDTVKKWQDKLAKGLRVTIENVGFLYLDAEKNIGFEQDRYSNLLLASYGLANVHFIPETDIQFVVNEKTGRTSIEESKEEIVSVPILPEEKIDIPVEEEIQKEQELAPIIELHPKKKAWKYIAAAVLLPIAFYSYWIPAKSDVLQSGLISIRDFNPASPQKQGVYKQTSYDFSIPNVEQVESVEKLTSTLPEDVDVFAFYYQNDIIIPVRLNKQVLPVTPEVQAPIPTLVPTIRKNDSKPVVSTPKKENVNPTSSKHLIVGCFSTADNANKLVSRLKSKGFDAYIVDVVNGLHRVSALNSSNDSALLSTTKRLNALQISTWILKK
jgi:CCDC81-like prokaryotic HU domain 1/CCDC81-like prokaryotic HU domain 2/SPOR domain